MNFGQFHTEPFYLKVAKGKVNGHSHIHKFGAVPAMSQNTTGTVWDVNDTVYPWSAFDTAGVLNIPAVNVSDTGKTVTIYGLDGNYNAMTETLTVSSSTTTTGTKSFKRVYRAFFNGAASNVGDVLINKGATTVAAIKAGKAQTLMAVYTVPAGFTGYLTKGVCTVQAGADGTGDMFVRYFGLDSFRVGHSFEVANAEYNYEFTFPQQLPEKSDIDVRVSVRSNNARVTAAFDMLLVDNRYIASEK